MNSNDIEFVVRNLVAEGVLPAPQSPKEVRRDRLDRMAGGFWQGFLSYSGEREWRYSKEEALQDALEMLDLIDAHLEQEGPR